MRGAKKKPKRRKDPRLGEVIAVPLTRRQWAYLCKVDDGGLRFYFFNFISTGVLVDSAAFSRENWLRPLIVSGDLPAAFATVGRMELDENEPYGEMCSQQKRALPGANIPAGAWFASNTLGSRRITPEEAALMPEMLDLEPDKLPKYFRALNLRVLPEKGQDAPPAPVEEAEDDSVDLQVTVYTGKCSYDPEQLAADIEEALEDADDLEWEMIDGSDGEIVVRAEKACAVRVANLMRRVMRKQLSPQQLESVDFEWIANGASKPLEVAPARKGRSKG